MTAAASPEDNAPKNHDLAAARSGRTSMWWCLAAVGALLVYIALRLVYEPRFFYWDDTQLGAFGQWYGLGTKLLRGDLSVLSPGSWQGGNYLAEGQWALWNPLVWLIALATHLVPGATLLCTCVKSLFLVMLVVGGYLVAREYGALPSWAAVAGFTAAMGGQTIFMDAPSWVSGLESVALFALAWWAFKRHIHRHRSPLPFFVIAYLLITLGYVFGVLELAALLITYLVISIVRRDRANIVRVLVAGVYAALLAVFIYLPGILTAPVTTRAGSGIGNDQFLNLDLGDLATSAVTTAVSSVKGYWGELAPVPIQYVAWLIPLLVIFGAGWRQTFRRVAAPISILLVTIAMAIGPSIIGPIRYPERMMPYAVLAFAVIFAAAASRQWTTRPARARVGAAVVLTGLSGWLGWAAQPDSWSWVLAAVVLQILAILVIFLPWRSWPVLASLPRRSAAALLIASLIVLVPQVMRYPNSPLGNFNVPSAQSAMRAVGDGKAPGIFTVGNVYSLSQDAAAYHESLLANLWYLTGKDSASVYTVLPYKNLAQTLCMDLRGATCPRALKTLFSGDVPIADDMALNTVVVIKGAGLTHRPTAPAGWTVESGRFTWILHRDRPLPGAGGVARTSAGTAVATIRRDATSVVFRVGEVPSGGGVVVLSRLAWPGYSTTGGAFASPDRGFLLTVNVTPHDSGREIVVQFAPPGWALELGAAITAAVLAIAASVIFWIRRRRPNSPRVHMSSEL